MSSYSTEKSYSHLRWEFKARKVHHITQRGIVTRR